MTRDELECEQAYKDWCGDSVACQNYTIFKAGWQASNKAQREYQRFEADIRDEERREERPDWSQII